MESPGMYQRVRRALIGKLAGYDASMRALEMDDYIAAPTAGASAGLTGALALAYRTATRQWPMHWSVKLPSSSNQSSLSGAALA
jgi:fructokinase